jgi:hypothetical protein
VSDLQRNDANRLPAALVAETAEHSRRVLEGAEIRGQEMDWVVRLALREALWCRLEGACNFYVHFGYDYYMYVGSENVDAPPARLPLGIYAEPMDSPYQGEEGDSL